jgi:hypothetical protein
MKFAVAFSSLLAVVTADINPESAVGQHLLSTARRLDQDQNDDAWLTSYSIKFQGCHTIKQWNYAADGEDDVRVMSKNLVRFRLCPSSDCSAGKAAGCSAGYGDYVVDMYDFMSSWSEASQQDTEYACYNYLQTSCSCNDDDKQADDFNREYCEYDCFNGAGMQECIDRNPYDEEQGNNNQKFNVEEYMACAQVKFNNNNRRQLNDDVKYYVGPYCSGQGGDIFLGFFSDESCSVPVEDVTFESLAGYELPNSQTSLVSSSCVSCVEHEMEDQKNEQEGGEADADVVSEACEALYIEAGKCESNYPEGMVATPNTAACTYMEGIKIVRQDGMIFQSEAMKSNAVATTFIVLFAVAFAGT